MVEGCPWGCLIPEPFRTQREGAEQARKAQERAQAEDSRRRVLVWAERSGVPTAGAGESRGRVRVWSAESVVSASIGLSCYLEQNYERTEQRSDMSCFVERR